MAQPDVRSYRRVGVGDRLGRYELGEELGAGGMASVYRATDTKLRREVAVKVLHPHLCKHVDVVRRFQREARAVAALDHPHILRIFDVGGGLDDDTVTAGQGDPAPPYIVMELIDGMSVREFLAEHGAPLGEIVACVGAVLCSALAEAHAAGIVHRDVKPANVMIAGDGRLVLSDFGVAHVGDEDSLVTQQGALLGTPAFMAPEQALGAAIDARTDVYALGATLYRLGTGALPFTGPAPKVISAITRGALESPLRKNPKLGGALAKVIVKMMAREPGERYAGAAEAREALVRITAAAGLADPGAELADYFRSPGEYNATRVPRIVESALGAARDAVREREIPHALSLADRVLDFEPDHREALDLVESLADGGHSPLRRWLPSAIGGAVVLAGIVVGVLVWRDTRGAVTDAVDAAADATADASAADTSAADASAADARAGGDAATVGAADASPPDARVRRRRRVDAAGSSVAPVRAADAAPAPVSIDASIPVPSVSVLVIDSYTAWCDLWIDGDKKGTVAKNQRFEVTPGTHRLRCEGAMQLTWTETIDVRPGETRRLAIKLGTDTINVRINVDGDAVTIGGTRHRNGDTVEITPGRYKIEVFNDNALRGSSYLSLESACTLRTHRDGTPYCP